jgi:hypothetical protein
MATSQEKGNALEAAVAAIESHILATSPGLREKTFFIESKKILTLGGVRHEVDIFVTIDLGQRYKSIFIFECKNWQGAVGKNEVVVFSETIEAVGATRGFLVAKSFTADAQAQAAKDARLVFLVASEHDPATIPLPIDIHTIITMPEHVDSTFHQWRSTSANLRPLPLDTAQAKLLGSDVNLRQYLLNWADQLCSDDVLSFRTERLAADDYDRTASAERRFGRGELSIDDIDMERAEISVRYKVRVVRLSVISHFEVESRGHFRLFAPVHLPTGDSLQFSMTTAQG